MDVTVSPTSCEDVVVLQPTAFEDERGAFFESWSSRTLARHGIDLTFVQDNHSRSGPAVVRGLHFQGALAPQWRLVRCTVGEVLDVVVDLRAGAPTLGRWTAVRLSAANRRQLLVPPHYAHGFAVVGQGAEVQYKCTGWHEAGAERALRWDDPDLAIDWQLSAPPVLSKKDAAAPSFADYLRAPEFVATPSMLEETA